MVNLDLYVSLCTYISGDSGPKCSTVCCGLLNVLSHAVCADICDIVDLFSEI
jgi:hypothetical protein